MSAGTELDRAAVAAGLFTPVDVVTVRPDGRGAPSGRERRRDDPVSRLGREHDVMCTQAVAPDEIAAGLEAAGINDRVVRERYGMANVFELAEVLYDRVPRRPRAPDVLEDPWDVPNRRHVARGAVYALPLLPYIAALRLFTDGGDIAVLLVGSAMTMAVSQGVAFVAYQLLGGISGPAAARRFLRMALSVTMLAAVVLVLGSIVGLGLTRGPSTVAAVSIVAGQLLFVVAATTLMVVHQERLVLLALIPGALAGILSIPWLDVPRYGLLATIGLVASLLATLVLAIRSVPLEGDPPAVPMLPSRSRRALLHVAYGAIASGLVLFAVLDSVQLGEQGSAHLLSMGMLPFILSLGAAEAVLHRFRSETAGAMRESFGFDRFAVLARSAMFRAAAWYALGLAALTAVFVPFLVADDSPTPEALRYVGYAELAIALLAAMLMISCGAVEQVLVVLSIGLVVDTLVRLGAGDAAELTARHCGVYLVILVVLWFTAMRTLVSPFRHR